MFQNVERYIDFLINNKISQQQFLLLYLIKTKKSTIMKKYMEAFPTHDGSMIGVESRQDLIDRGFLKHNSELGKGIESYIVTEKFENVVLKDRVEAADQFWKRYPGFVNIGGRDLPLTNADRYAFSILYVEMIGYDYNEHREVLKDLEFGANRGLIKNNIEKFVKAKMWEPIRAIRLGEQAIKKVEGTVGEEEFN